MKCILTYLAASTPLLSAGNPVFFRTEREMFLDVIFVELGPAEDPVGKPTVIWNTSISGQFSCLLSAANDQTTFTGKN